MIKKTTGEKWEPFRFKGYKGMRNKYAISSLGHIASFREDLHTDGKLLKGSVTGGYRTFNIHTENTSFTVYIHREVARIFVPKKNKKANIVIHLNHDKTDNRSKNLQWATVETSINHQQKSPAKKAYKLRQQNRTRGLKLTTANVKAIKKTLNNPRRRLTIRQIAEKYGVSEMTIYRIKRGENWGRI